jgi:hypothetical protein
MVVAGAHTHPGSHCTADQCCAARRDRNRRPWLVKGPAQRFALAPDLGCGPAGQYPASLALVADQAPASKLMEAIANRAPTAPTTGLTDQPHRESRVTPTIALSITRHRPGSAVRAPDGRNARNGGARCSALAITTTLRGDGVA